VLKKIPRGMVALGFLVCVATAQSPVPPNVAATLETAVKAHGGEALTGMKTYSEDAAITASVLGVGVYNLRFRTTVDFTERRGRIEIFNNGTLQTIYQLTPQGARTWTPKDGTKDAPSPVKPDAPFTFSTPVKAGILGLLAVGKAQDEKLSGDSSIEIQGVKGASIKREAKSYQATYVFDSSGALAVERTVLVDDKGKKTEFTLVYNAFKILNGVRVPMSAKIYSSQIPGFASAELKVTAAAVNPTLAVNAFTMP
jgi:hypothetical protein